MKASYKTLFLGAILSLSACTKKNTPPCTNNPVASSEHAVNDAPYGTFSSWKSIGGDSLFADTLTLTLFYTETHSPCDTYYYQQNYALWNDYDYTYAVSKCAKVNDTLKIKDIATGKVAFFNRLK